MVCQIPGCLHPPTNRLDRHYRNIHGVASTDTRYVRDRTLARKQRQTVADNLIDIAWSKINEAVSKHINRPVPADIIDAVCKGLAGFGCRYIPDIPNSNCEGAAIHQRAKKMKRKNAASPETVSNFDVSSGASKHIAAKSANGVKRRRRIIDTDEESNASTPMQDIIVAGRGTGQASASDVL